MHFKRCFLISMSMSLFFACYAPQRDCSNFREGTFRFTAIIDGEEKTTSFTRVGDLEIDYLEGEADSSSVRWINDCEYVVKKINPKNSSEEKAVHIKILSTTSNSYTFEYGLVGQSNKLRGTAFKTD